MNLPDKAICDREKPWGCDYDDILRTQAYLKNHGVTVLPAKAGDVFYNSGRTRLEVLYAFDGIHTPVGTPEINDMSLILRLTQGKTRALFTGDLNNKLGTYLAGRSEVRADILKVPHLARMPFAELLF